MPYDVTDADRFLLTLLSEGYSNEEIADELHYSRTHVAALLGLLYRRLGLWPGMYAPGARRARAVAIAFHRGYIEI